MVSFNPEYKVFNPDLSPCVNILGDYGEVYEYEERKLKESLALNLNLNQKILVVPSILRSFTQKLDRTILAEQAIYGKAVIQFGEEGNWPFYKKQQFLLENPTWLTICLAANEFLNIVFKDKSEEEIHHEFFEGIQLITSENITLNKETLPLYKGVFGS